MGSEMCIRDRDWRGPLQRWREQLQLFSPALLRARRRATAPTLQHSPSIHSREATRPSARPRPHLLCFNVLPWSQRASRHDSIAMAGSAVDRKGPGPLCRAACAGATQIRALAPSIQFPHSVVVVLSARTARTAIQRLMDGAQSPRRIRTSRAHRLEAQSAAADRLCLWSGWTVRWTVFVAVQRIIAE